MSVASRRAGLTVVFVVPHIGDAMIREYDVKEAEWYTS